MESAVYRFLTEGIRSGRKAYFHLFYLLTAWEVIEHIRAQGMEEANVPLAVETVYTQALQELLEGDSAKCVKPWLLSLADTVCKNLSGVFE